MLYPPLPTEAASTGRSGRSHILHTPVTHLSPCFHKLKSSQRHFQDDLWTPHAELRKLREAW